MRIALAVPCVIPDNLPANLEAMRSIVRAAAAQNAGMIVFSEAALTGLTHTGDPDQDLTLGQVIPGPVINNICQMAQEHTLWIAFGLFERGRDNLYDTAVLIDPRGAIRLRYRRIDPHWHHWHSRPCSNLIYQTGTEVKFIDMPFGRCAFLICGDLFNPTCLGLVKDVDWLIVPMARCFDTDVATPQQWYSDERHYYGQQAAQIGVNMLLVNQLACLAEGGYFGGATVFDRQGAIIAEHPIQQLGMLIVDL